MGGGGEGWGRGVEGEKHIKLSVIKLSATQANIAII